MPPGACGPGSRARIGIDVLVVVLVGLVLAAACWVGSASAAPEVVIHELRIDQPGADTDEYVELAAPPGTSLAGLTYLVLGDGAASAGRGVVEAVVPLDGLVAPASGLLVLAERSFTIGTADRTLALAFENGDPVTHMLVAGFDGALGDDLDVDDDGMLDQMPFTDVLDAVALLASRAVPPTGSAYLIDERVGPGESGVPWHVLRCPDRVGGFVLGADDPAALRDSPGEPNRCPPPQGPPRRVSIPEIQGRDHTSAYVALRIVTQGVVTAVDSSGFFLQDPRGDNDPRTSDAIFAFAGEAPRAAVGARIEIEGTVAEFVPGGPATHNLSTTELVDIAWEELASDAVLPPPVLLGPPGRSPPGRIVDDDALARFDPARDAIDFFESLEAMRVSIPSAVAVAPNGRFGQIYVIADAASSTSRRSGGGVLSIAERDFQPERIQLRADSGVLAQRLPEVRAGDLVRGVVGVVTYAFGAYAVTLSEPLGPVLPAVREPDATILTDPRCSLRVATFNVKNLDSNDRDGDADVRAGRFSAIARVIAVDLDAPHIIALQEVQDDSGAADTGETSAARTLTRIADEIAAAGGPRYAAVDHPHVVDGAGGGQPGGNIRVAFLYDASRVALHAESVGSVVDPILQRADPSAPFFGSRFPLEMQVSFADQTVTLINLHLTSKSGSPPLFGSLQPVMTWQEHPMVNRGVQRRRAQASAVASHVESILARDSGAHVVVLGDMNELAFVSPLRDELSRALANLTWSLPRTERYTFLFDGAGQALDHVLVSPSLLPRARLDVVHVSTGEAESPGSASDHDPVVACLDVSARSARRARRAARIARVLWRLRVDRALRGDAR